MADPVIDSVTLDSNTVELGSTLPGTITGTYDAPETNPDLVVDVLGYFSGQGEQVLKSVTLSGGAFSVPFTIPVPNDSAYLGDQWTYAGLDSGSWMSLKGNGVTVVEPATVSEANLSIPTCGHDLARVQPGDTLGLNADVRNANTIAADVELSWTVGGATFTSAVVTVPAGATQTVQENITLDDATISALGGYGDHPIEVTISQFWEAT